MIETARTSADRFHAEFIVAYVKQSELSAAENAALEDKMIFARSAGAEIAILDGEDPIDTILDFARSRSITQLFVGHTQSLRRWPWGDPVDKLIRKSHGMDVRIFPN
jgi:two-component system sensor histidine kinase KdpD